MYLGCFIQIMLIVWMRVKGSPAGNDEERRDMTVKVYDKLRQPLKDIMSQTQRIAIAFVKEKQLENVGIHENLRKSCESQIGQNKLNKGEDRQKRLTYAMKINQELVKHLQIMQMKESAINKERYAVFSHKFRGLEYQIRRFVETYLRDAAKSMSSDRGTQQIPAYSIGNSQEIKIKEVDQTQFNKQNLQILLAILFCTKSFLYNDIVKVAGKDRSMKMQAPKEQFRMPPKFTTEFSSFQENITADADDQSIKSTGSELTGKYVGRILKHEEENKKLDGNRKGSERVQNPVEHLGFDKIPKQSVLDQLNQHLLDLKKSKNEHKWGLFGNSRGTKET